MTTAFFNSYVFRLEIQVAETLVCNVLFYAGHEHRSCFWLRLVATFVVCIGICFPLGALYALSVDTGWFLLCKFSVYIITYALSVIGFSLCYRDNLSELVLCGISSVAAQSFLSNLTTIVYSGWTLVFENVLMYQLVDLLRKVPFFALIYFLFAFRSPRLKENGAYGFLIFLSISTLIVTIGLSGLVPVYASESQSLALIGYIFALICSCFVLVIRRVFVSQMNSQRDLTVEEMLRKQEQKQYDRLKSSMELINVKCHDIKHYMSGLEDKLDADSLSGLSAAVAAFDSFFSTGNETLDTILNEKNNVCIKHGITFTCTGDGSAFAAIKPVDLYSLFGNALDNAIEAEELVTDPDKKAINLRLSSDNGAQFDLMNYFMGKLMMKDGRPVTSKNDSFYHGYGVRSMQLTVKLYGGVMNFSAQNDIFRLQVCFPNIKSK